MDIERAAEELNERKLVRRGLLTGIAALGAAAVMHMKGAGKAEAADGDGNPVLLGNIASDANGQSLSTETRIVANPGISTPVLHVTNGGTLNVGRSAITGIMSGFNAPAIHGVTTFAGGVAVQGLVSGTTGTGVLGFAGGTSGFGVVGNADYANANTSIGVEGRGSSTGIGIRGVHTQNGTGIKGVSNNGAPSTKDGDGFGIGVHGKSGGGPGVKGESTDAVGVLGVSVNQAGVEGTSTNSLGIRGTSTNFVGLFGQSTNNHGLYGSSSSLTAFGIVAENVAGGPGLLVTGGAQIYGPLQVFGAKNAVIKMQDGSNAAVYCQESPEPYFEDFGRAQLAGGVAKVPLEREFAQLVAGGDYMVFPVAEGLCGNLCVTSRGASGFEVREANGQSNVPFTYRIVTRRKDIEGKRFARVNTDAAQSIAATRAALGIGTGSPLPNPGPFNNVVPPTPVSPPTGVLPGVTGQQNQPQPGPSQGPTR